MLFLRQFGVKSVLVVTGGSGSCFVSPSKDKCHAVTLGQCDTVVRVLHLNQGE